MTKNSDSVILFGAVVLIIAACIGVALWHKHGVSRVTPNSGTAQILPVREIPSIPRTEMPLEDYTRFYTRKLYRVTHAGKEFFSPGQEVQYNLTYFWFQPAGAPYPTGLKFPLVLILHGTPGNSYAGKFLIGQQNQLDFPAFVVVPVLQQGWTWDNPKQIDGYPEMIFKPHLVQALPGTVQLVEQIAKNYPVDTSRIYVVGCSEGGMGAFGAVRDFPDVFAGAVPMSSGWTFSDAPKMTKVPMWIFQGGQDPVVPPALPRTLASLIKQNGGKVMYSELPDLSHECPSPQLYTHAMWQWLFSQHK